MPHFLLPLIYSRGRSLLTTIMHIPWLARVPPSRVLLTLFLYSSLILSTVAQTTSSTPIASDNVTVIRGTTSFTSTSISSSGTQTLALVNVFPTTYNVTLTLAATPTSSVNASASASASASSTASATVLATKIDPAFSVLGTVLILTGLPSAFLGHKNRWLVHSLSAYNRLTAPLLGRLSS
jgi:hypothetical protein